MSRVAVRYFASLRDAAGIEGETVEATASLGELYDLLATRHRWRLARARLRVAVNGAFASWSDVPVDGDEVVFIPPVSGG
jgi:molybdopterin converting factor subunit 1